jgi:hypothetical protein
VVLEQGFLRGFLEHKDSLERLNPVPPYLKGVLELALLYPRGPDSGLHLGTSSQHLLPAPPSRPPRERDVHMK